jgi:ribosome-associated protein
MIPDASMDALLPEEPGRSLAPGVSIAAGGLRIKISRGGGPGGQNVNKLNTKAQGWIQLSQLSGMSAAAIQRLRGLSGRRLTGNDELHLVCETERTQEGNRRELFERLRELIVQAKKEPKPHRKTRPTAASRRRRLESKRHRSEIKGRRSGKDVG